MPIVTATLSIPFGLVIDRELLGLSVAFALVVVLYWMVITREEAEEADYERLSPNSLDELARAVFEVAIDADLDGYRELFLAGREAAEVYGERAAVYLESRGIDVLEDALVTIGALIPEGSRFGGVENTGPEMIAIRVVPPNGADPYLVHVGQVAQVHGVYRLQKPAQY